MPVKHSTAFPLMNLHILVGTMTDNATRVADEIEHHFAARAQITVNYMDQVDRGVFNRNELFLICTSTYGQGDVPDNAKQLYDALCSERPDLNGVRYGVFGLGDRTYAETFNNGGKRFDEILRELGAERIGERYQHDASSGDLPEEVAVEWFAQWFALCEQRVSVAA